MEQRHRAIKLFLCRFIARRGKMHLAQFLPGCCRVLMFLRGDTLCCQNQNASAKDSRAQHGRPFQFQCAL
jgi:hypothetical protein